MAASPLGRVGHSGGIAGIGLAAGVFNARADAAVRRISLESTGRVVVWIHSPVCGGVVGLYFCRVGADASVLGIQVFNDPARWAGFYFVKLCTKKASFGKIYLPVGK